MRISSARNIPHRWAVVAIVLLLALLVPAAAMADGGQGTGRTGAVNQCSGRDGTHTHDRRGGDMAGAHF